MKTYATIGTSSITQSFIQGADLTGNWKLAGIYSRTRERGEAFLKELGGLSGDVCLYTDLEALADSDVDAVYIASPNSLHYAQSKFLLERGKHVLCEKPITVLPEECAELTSFAKQKGLVYFEAIMLLHNPVRHKLAEAMGKIGRISSAHFDFSQLSSQYPALKRGETPNVFNPARATGCLMDLGIYCVYPALYFWGEPREITAKASLLPNGIDSGGAAFFRYADGKLVTLTYDKTAQDRLGSQIFGDEGTITIGSISKLTDIALVYKDGTREHIHGDTPKPALMGYEARSLYEFITAPEKTAECYLQCGELALAASKVMREMRQQVGIQFQLETS